MLSCSYFAHFKLKPFCVHYRPYCTQYFPTLHNLLLISALLICSSFIYHTRYLNDCTCSKRTPQIITQFQLQQTPTPSPSPSISLSDHFGQVFSTTPQLSLYHSDQFFTYSLFSTILHVLSFILPPDSPYTKQ